jgi:hypothetical protein
MLLAGCGSSTVYLPAAETRPPLIVTNAYTRGGCVDKLKKEAQVRDVTIEVTKVTKELGFGPFLFPFYRDYLCHGEVQAPAAAK